MAGEGVPRTNPVCPPTPFRLFVEKATKERHKNHNGGTVDPQSGGGETGEPKTGKPSKVPPRMLSEIGVLSRVLPRVLSRALFLLFSRAFSGALLGGFPVLGLSSRSAVFSDYILILGIKRNAQRKLATVRRLFWGEHALVTTNSHKGDGHCFFQTRATQKHEDATIKQQ